MLLYPKLLTRFAADHPQGHLAVWSVINPEPVRRVSNRSDFSIANTEGDFADNLRRPLLDNYLIADDTIAGAEQAVNYVHWQHR